MLSELNRAQKAYLDIMRALASMAVLVSHAAFYFYRESCLAKLGMGGVGVYIFFLLSGFLITMSAISHQSDGTCGFRSFMIDRFCRIYCAYIPALILVYLFDRGSVSLLTQLSQIDLSGMPGGIERVLLHHDGLSAFSNLLMLQGYPVFKLTSVIGPFPEASKSLLNTFGSGEPFWTLSIEWWIYVVFGALFYTRGRMGYIGGAACCLVAVQPFYFMVGGHGQCLSLMWLCGMGIAFYWGRLNKLTVWQRAGLSLFFALTLLARGLFIKYKTGQYDFAEFQLGIFMAGFIFSVFFLLKAVDNVPEHVAKICKFLADYSYSLYLTHFPLIVFAYLKYRPESGWLSLLIIVVVANFQAIIFWWLFERHYRRLARWLVKRTS